MRATETYEKQIRRRSVSAGAQAYLTEHGIGEYAVARKYRLGYVAEPLQGDKSFAGRLAIPYLSKSGPVSIKFRRLGDSGAKFLYHTGQKHRLYNSAAYYDADTTIGICEGEIDAIVATERLGVPTMGIPGAGAWQEKADIWSPVFKDFRRVWIFADGDEPGTNLANDIASSLGWRARIVQCAAGEDVGSMVAAGRADELRKLTEE